MSNWESEQQLGLIGPRFPSTELITPDPWAAPLENEVEPDTVCFISPKEWYDKLCCQQQNQQHCSKIKNNASWSET